MEGDIELDDVRVVNVTGKVHKDKNANKQKKSRCWSPSLRSRTIIIFICIGIVYVVGAVVLVTEMRKNLESLDEEALYRSINRFSMLFYGDVARLQPYTRHAAWQRVTAEAAMNTSDKTLINRFIQRYLNTSIIYHEDGTSEHVYRCGSMVNWWGIIHPKSYVTLWSEYHPGKDGEYCTLAAAKPWEVQPVFPPPYFQGIINSDAGNPDDGWKSVFHPGRVADPMSISIEAIMIPDEDGNVTDKTIYGYLVAAKNIQPHMSTFASNVPGCITMVSDENEDSFDELDNEMWNTTVPGTWAADFTFSGVPNFTIRDAKYLNDCQYRYCPAIPLFNDTETMMTGYFRICGQDPKKTEKNTCMNFRMDRPMSRVEEGTNPVIYLSILVVGLMIILFVVFIIFLDCAVLRRVVRLSNAIHKQTYEHHDVFNNDADQDKPAENVGGKKKGKSAGDEDGSSLNHGDEINNLKHAVEQNTRRLRKRVEAVNDVVKTERQRILHHKQAMQLLSLWCDRNEFYPGLRPNATLLRYEPTRNLDDLLLNPLAVEYLKSHCDSDCTLENLFFLLDVSWLSELEAAEDNEKDPAKRKQIHQVASATASTIISRYIAEDAPQQINIAAGTFEILRRKGKSYKRGMFKEAVAEVKLMLNTDILPRFHKTPAYTAMSENLYIDSFAMDDDSDLSSESLSTAGSVLSDDSNSSANHMVAFNFRNLYATFDGDTDLGSTYTNEFSVIEPGEKSEMDEAEDDISQPKEKEDEEKDESDTSSSSSD